MPCCHPQTQGLLRFALGFIPSPPLGAGDSPLGAGDSGIYCPGGSPHMNLRVASAPRGRRKRWKFPPRMRRPQGADVKGGSFLLAYVGRRGPTLLLTSDTGVGRYYPHVFVWRYNRMSRSPKLRSFRAAPDRATHREIERWNSRGGVIDSIAQGRWQRRSRSTELARRVRSHVLQDHPRRKDRLETSRLAGSAGQSHVLDQSRDREGGVPPRIAPTPPSRSGL